MYSVMQQLGCDATWQLLLPTTVVGKVTLGDGVLCYASASTLLGRGSDWQHA
jgi:hypothetical protein